MRFEIYSDSCIEYSIDDALTLQQVIDNADEIIRHIITEKQMNPCIYMSINVQDMELAHPSIFDKHETWYHIEFNIFANTYGSTEMKQIYNKAWEDYTKTGYLSLHC